MSMSYCTQTRSYFCADCAAGVSVVNEPFYAWAYYRRLRSPWSGQWQPTLDRLEFDGRHPALTGAADQAPVGLAAERDLLRYPIQRSQWAANGSLDSRRLWNDNAKAWDDALDADGDTTRKYFSDAPMMRMLGPVAGLDVLDFGCGNGYLSRKLAELGARMTGVDQSEGMLARARAHEFQRPVGIRFVHATIASVAALAAESFDRVVSNYVLHDLSDYNEAVAEAYRVLRPGGRFVVVITHPCFSTGPRTWELDAIDSPRLEERRAFSGDQYFQRAPYLMEWDGFAPVPYFHRPLRDYWQAFRKAGFDVCDFEEPSLNAKGRGELPAWQAEQLDRVPLACVFQLVKPAPA
jgi:SAM-dependent methyltransferase